jgi:hypothetical protein
MQALTGVVDLESRHESSRHKINELESKDGSFSV